MRRNRSSTVLAVAVASGLVLAGTALTASAASVASTVAAGAPGATSMRYVTTTGTDTGTCSTAATACRTVQYAADQAAAGDTISIAAGHYAQAVDVRQPLTLAGAPDGATVLSPPASGPTVPGIVDVGTLPGQRVQLRNLRLTGNSAGRGLLIVIGSVSASALEVDHNQIGIDARDTLALADSAVADNEYTGLDSTGDLSVDRSMFTGNGVSRHFADGPADAGVMISGGHALVQNTTLDRNGDSGMFVTDISGEPAPSVSLVRSTASGAYAGVTVTGARPRLTIDESTLADDDAGLVDRGARVVVRATTITGIRKIAHAAPSTANAAVYVGRSGRWTGSVAVSGTIIAGNQVANCSARVRDGGYNLSDDRANTCGFSTTRHSHPRTPARLGAFAYRGGPTETVITRSHSAARDEIPYGRVDCLAGMTDQRGMPRRSPRSGRCDIGSVEAHE